MAKTLRTLVENAHKNAVCIQRYRISRQDAERVRQAENIGGRQAGLRVLLEILFKKAR